MTTDQTGNLRARFVPIQRHTRKFTTGRDPMAMTMTGEVQLSANREAVWAMLNEPTVLKSCIPGCESLDKDSDTEFRAVATIKISEEQLQRQGKLKAPLDYSRYVYTDLLKQVRPENVTITSLPSK